MYWGTAGDALMGTLHTVDASTGSPWRPARARRGGCGVVQIAIRQSRIAVEQRGHLQLVAHHGAARASPARGPPEPAGTGSKVEGRGGCDGNKRQCGRKPPSFVGSCRRYWWPQKKGRGTAGEGKVGYLPQCDSFMGIRCGIGGLLEMLLLQLEAS